MTGFYADWDMWLVITVVLGLLLLGVLILNRRQK